MKLLKQNQRHDAQEERKHIENKEEYLEPKNVQVKPTLIC